MISIVNLGRGFALLLEVMLSDAIVSPEELAALQVRYFDAAGRVAPT